MTTHVYDPTAISMTPAAQDHVGQPVSYTHLTLPTKA